MFIISFYIEEQNWNGLCYLKKQILYVPDWEKLIIDQKRNFENEYSFQIHKFYLHISFSCNFCSSSLYIFCKLIYLCVYIYKCQSRYELCISYCYCMQDIFLYLRSWLSQ